MARHRIKKYSRRRARSPYKNSAAPIVISVIAFVLLSLIVSVAIGIALGRRGEQADTDKRFDFDRVDYDSNGKKVSAVEAYHFPLGASPADYVYQEITDLSVCVSHKDGTLDYAFDIADNIPVVTNGERAFDELCSAAGDEGARVCAYLYIKAFTYEEKYERDVMKAYEIALINEISESGADDILLLGLDVTEDNIDEIEDFVARAATAAGKTPLGVAVSEETLALTENEVYLAARLRSSCDYLALDLTRLTVADGNSEGVDENGDKKPSRLEKILAQNEYYIKRYPMRVIFSQAESKIYQSALALGVVDMQIIAE